MSYEERQLLKAMAEALASMAVSQHYYHAQKIREKLLLLEAKEERDGKP